MPDDQAVLARDDPGRNESEAQRDDRGLAELLQELRVAGLGVQVLFGFLLSLPFSVRFVRLSGAQRDLYVTSLVLSALSTALLCGPVAYHRLVFRRHQKARLLRTANVMALAGLGAVGLAISSRGPACHQRCREGSARADHRRRHPCLLRRIVVRSPDGTTTGVLAGSALPRVAACLPGPAPRGSPVSHESERLMGTDMADARGASADGIITKDSPRSVVDTVARLVDIVAARGLKLFAVIDHSDEARNVGLELRDTKVVIFGSPQAGTPVMATTPLAALDLPLKVLVWADGDQTKVSYTSPPRWPIAMASATIWLASLPESMRLPTRRSSGNSGQPDADPATWNSGGMMDEARASALLGAERQRVEGLLRDTTGAGQEDRAAANEPGDLADPAERQTAEEADDAIAAGLRQRLDAIDRAEARIREGTFGLSVRSGLPIPDARLEADPAAELTVEEAGQP